MTQLKTVVLFILTAITVLTANPDVTSREYKLMLQVDSFSYASEATDVDAFLDDAESAIETAINRSVTGTETLSKIRDVMFYDTDGDCDLKNIGYSFRERVEDSDSEVTLKFRSPDRYISDFEDLSATSGQAETKLESDIGINAISSFTVVYGHSTKAPNTRTINEMEDINDQFPGFDDDYNFSNSLSLSLVGDLTVREHVYKGREIDLGSFDADISVTLWYNGVPSGSETPLVVEVSFKYEDSSADYSKNVVNRAKTSFEALQELTDWTDPNSKTKTKFVYEYDPDFCD